MSTEHFVWSNRITAFLLLFFLILGGGCTMRRPSASSSPAVLPHDTPRDSLALAPDSSFSSAPTLPEVATALGKEAPLGLDSLPPDSLGRLAALPDSLPATILPDSLSEKVEEPDSLSTPPEGQEKPIVLESVIEFSAEDSIVMLGQNRVYFFGKGKVDYQSMNIQSNFMHINTDSSEVYAQYVLDDEGHPIAYPTFTDGKQKFESETMRYNFRTEKGYITGILTQQGEGFLMSDEAKRMPDNTMYIQGGRYTTCDNHLNPHFYLQLTRAKVVPDKNIVAGPAYMVMGGVPLYLIGLPFGFFPFNEQRTSGLIMPSYGEEADRGFYLRGLGLYYAINDYVDLTARADLYTKGSWGLSLESNYRRRYMYSGHFSAGYVSTSRGDKQIPGDYSKSKDFTVNWSHTQDPKVDPLRTFSASVNFSTSSYNHNSIDRMYDPDRRAENTKGSSVSYSRRFTSIPLSLTAALNIDQRSRDSTLSVSLPNLSVSLSTIYPFKRKKRVGKGRWYEKISMSYSGSFRNSITTKENLILQSSLVRDWRNGMQHSIPISASFDLFDYIRITPSVSYNAKWYTSRSTMRYDDEKKRLVDADTTFGFYHINDFSVSLSASTTLYGFYKPWKIFGDKVQMIRHRITPSVSLGYTPDFSDPFWGYYRTVQYTTPEGEWREEPYNLYRNGIFGAPGRGKSGALSFSFSNNLEMKIRTLKSDSTDSEEAFKKISLIDQLDWRASYNMMADSLRWSNISASISFRFSSRFSLRLSGEFDTYLYDYRLDSNGKPIPFRVDKLRLLNGKGFGRLIGTGTGFSYQFNNQSWGKLVAFYHKVFKKKGSDAPEEPPLGDTSAPRDDASPSQTGPINLAGEGVVSRQRTSEEILGEHDADGYVLWNFPWNFSFNYSMNLGYDRANFDMERKEFRYKLTHNLSFRGDFKPTKNWSFMFDANYNFDLKRITNMTLSISRDLHCWQLSASVIPIGPYKSYTVTIGVKSQLLKDLKYQQSNLTTSNNVSWY